MVEAVINPNLPALAPTAAIRLSDGSSIALPAGGLGALLTGGNGGGNSEPLFRVIAGQPRDDFRAGSNQFYLKRNMRDKETNDKYVEVVGPFSSQLRALPIGYRLNRAFGEWNAASKEYTEFCHSENFLEPDARYRGNVLPGTDHKGNTVVAHECARVENGIRVLCPMAKWGPKDPKTGKSQKPICGEVYIVALAIEVDHDVLDMDGKPYMDKDENGKDIPRHLSGFVLAEAYYKSSGATDGKNIVRALANMQAAGTPIFTFPVLMELAEAGPSNFAKGTLLSDQPLLAEGETSEYFGYVLDSFSEINKRWDSAVQYNLNRSNWIPNTEDNGAAPSQEVDISTPRPQSPLPSRKPPAASVEEADIIV